MSAEKRKEKNKGVTNKEKNENKWGRFDGKRV